MLATTHAEPHPKYVSNTVVCITTTMKGSEKGIYIYFFKCKPVSTATSRTIASAYVTKWCCKKINNQPTQLEIAGRN